VDEAPGAGVTALVCAWCRGPVSDQRDPAIFNAWLAADGRSQKTFETVRLRGHAAGARNGALGLGQLVVRWVASAALGAGVPMSITAARDRAAEWPDQDSSQTIT